MNLKERVESHIVPIIIGSCVVTGGVVFTVENYFHSQHSEREEQAHVQSFKELQITHSQDIAKLESRLASIERGMPDQKFYDIRDLIYTSDEGKELPNGTTYFDEAEFYAFTDGKHWRYQKTTEAALFKLLAGEELEGPLADLANRPVHFWRTGTDYTIEYGGDIYPFFPNVQVSRIAYSELPNLLNVGVSFAKWLEDDEDFSFDAEDLTSSGHSEGVDGFIAAMSSSMRHDMTGILFLFRQLQSLQSALIDPENEHYRLLKVQKLGNVHYSHSLTTYKNVVVNGNPKKTFYERVELILVAGKNHIFMIQISLPSLEPVPRGDAYSELNAWLANLRVVVN